MRLITSDGYSGLLVRRLLLATVLVPLFLECLILQGVWAGVFDTVLALSLFAIGSISLFVWLIWYGALGIERVIRQRDRFQAALNANEERLRSFVEANVVGILFGDIYGNISNANDEYLRIIGYNREDLEAGRIRWQDITPSEYWDLEKERIAEAQKDGACKPYEKEYIRKDGTRIPVLVGYALAGEKRQESIAFILDLSERKQVEAALQESEATLRSQQQWLEYLLNLMPSPLLLIEPKTAKVIFANHAADELAGGEFPKGKPAEEYHTVYHCTDAEGNPIPDEQMPGVRVARGERLESIEIDWHTPGGIRSLLIFADTLPAMHGHAATCVLMFQDISNRKYVEKALSLGYRRLQLLFGTASDLLSSQQPIALLDSVFRSLSEQIGLDCYFNFLVDETQQKLHLASYQGVSEEFANQVTTLQFNQGICGKAAINRRFLTLENVQNSTAPETDLIRSLGITAFASYPLISGGQLFGTLGFGSLTKLRFTQNEIGMMQAVCDQIAIAIERSRLVGSLQQQTEQLREANRMKDEFLAVLSHELRSPLNAIFGWAQLLRTRPHLEEAKKIQALETIERNARTQKQLIEDLLDISRIVRGKLRLNVTSCNLVPIVEAAIDTVRIAAAAKEIEILFSIRDTEWEASQKIVSLNKQTQGQVPRNQASIFYPKVFVTGDAERLQQVIWNLLTNAIKFTNPGGEVEIKLAIETNPESVLIQVRDSGMGIKPEFIPYVFDRFRQEDSSSTRTYGGLGLGLAIVRHLVELHGGTVSADSPGTGKGATFTVKLPLLYRQEENPPSAPLHPPLSPLPSLAGVRVLIVDDEADTLDFLVTVLEQSQAQVQTATSVSEAIACISQSQPDVLVSDIGMPSEDGYSLIRKIRQMKPEAGGNIPAAALTAYARTEDRMRAIQEGFQLHLPKPVEPEELIAVVASLAGRGIVN
ncbi:multi-sensor hybrid histidine kinase [Calothrix sp. NIES-4101]|nr:multi-sensor hybrid histidine kinase [Calothrix sp. NIES-4101]